MKLSLFKGNGDVALAIRKALRRATLNAFVGLINVAASLGFVYVSKQLIDTATGVAHHPMGPNIALLCGLMALRLVSSVANGYIGGRNSAQALMALRQGFFDRLMRMRWNGTETFHSGDAVNRMEEDVRVVVDFICANLPGFILAALQLVFASVFVYLMAPELIFILLVFMVVASVVGFLLYRPVKRLTKAIRTQDGIVQSHLQESFQNRITVKVLQGVERMTDRLAVLQGKQFADTMKRLNYSTLAQMFLRLGFMAGYTVAFVFGVLGIRKGAITFGMMTALLQLVGQVGGNRHHGDGARNAAADGRPRARSQGGWSRLRLSAATAARADPLLGRVSRWQDDRRGGRNGRGQDHPRAPHVGPA